MRRSDREITGESAIEQIILACDVCRLAVSDGDRPYIVPLCFGYRDRTFYFHSAAQGHKIDTLRKNPRVCLELDTDTGIVTAERACGWGMRYRSVIGFGTAELVEDHDEKREALEIIMNHYSDRSLALPDADLERTAVIRVTVEGMTGKQSGYGKED